MTRKYGRARTAFEFKADLLGLGKLFEIEGRELASITALTMFSKVVEKTPVKEGVARGNWRLTEGAPNFTWDKSQKHRPDADIPSGKQTSYITNSVPYIVPLEFGHSGRSPNGMVRVSMEEMRAFL